MGGGLMQLVAYGAQDIYLTGNPQITFFKVVYRRHTNFAMEAIEQVFNGVANFGNRVVCTIARNGDLVGRMYLEIDFDPSILNNDGEQYVNSMHRLGYKLIKSAEVEIGGQRIDKHYGEWMDIWNQLSQPTNQLHKINEMVNGNLRNNDNRKLYIPLQFWFNCNPGLALPLIALQYHEVKVTIDFEKANNINFCKVTSDLDTNDTCADNNLWERYSAINLSDKNCSVAFSNCCLYCDYIFLDTDERRRFAQVSHEYLIEQLQETGTCSFSRSQSKVNIPLNFNHPVKELVWVVQNTNQKGTFNFTQNNVAGGDGYTREFVNMAKIQLNGHDRFRERQGSYFRCVQPYQCHSGMVPQGQSLPPAGDISFSGANNVEFGYIYCYSFALKPEEHQPSGTCNFSRIDNAVLNMSLAESDSNEGKDVRVYATNYNVLRIMSGMGGLAYSN